TGSAGDEEGVHAGAKSTLRAVMRDSAYNPALVRVVFQPQGARGRGFPPPWGRLGGGMGSVCGGKTAGGCLLRLIYSFRESSPGSRNLDDSPCHPERERGIWAVERPPQPPDPSLSLGMTGPRCLGCGREPALGVRP